MKMQRRQFLGGLSAIAAAPALRGGPGEAPAKNQEVHFLHDGIQLAPGEYVQLLSRLAEEKQIASDTYSLGGIVTELEQTMAARLGKECAVFLPTGTLANHLAVRILAHGHKVLVQAESHLYNDEGDCAQRLSGLNLVPLAEGKAAFALSDVEEAVDRASHGRVDAPVGAISIESPVRRKNGEVVPFEEMKRICTFAREHGIGSHLDGARVFMATPYTGVTPAQYAALYDTVYISLYKYFNANFGAILAGPRKLLENLYHTRRMFGGGLPHVWPEAAVALHYMDGFETRLGKAVGVSEALLNELSGQRGFQVQRITPGSNIAIVSLPAADPKVFQARLKSSGITIPPPRTSQSAGRIEMTLAANESLVRRTPDDLARAFRQAAALR